MITFSGVSKQFGEDSFALKDISFDIQPGEFVIITGHSGSGKTTLMRLLTREYTPSEGEITFDGEPLSEIRNNQVHHHRRKIGVVFQDYKLLPELNVWENIALALNIIGKPQAEIEMRVSDLLRLVGIVEKAFLFPSQLSGGEAQRVSIARALATGPSVIFADEPTGNLDPETSGSIARLFKKINSLGTIVMIATHDTGVLETLKAERRLHLDQGLLVKDSGGLKPSKVTTTQPIKPPTSATSPTAPAAEPVKPPAKESSPIEKEAEAKPEKIGWKLKLPSFKLPFGRGKTDPSQQPTSSKNVTSDSDNEVKSHKEFHNDKNDDDTVEVTVKVEKL